MGENIVETQMDEHLMNIQRETKWALDRFEQSGLKVDRKFINHFQKVTVDRVTQTCKRFEAESKWRTPHSGAFSTAPNPEQPKIDLTNSPRIDRETKRKPETSEDAAAEEAKKLKLDAAQGNVAKEEPSPPCHLKSTKFYCVHCFDQADASQPFTGTVEDVYEHWLVSHADNSISKPFQFYAVVLANCFYCETIGTYHELLKHQKEQHPSQAFIICDRMDRGTCGICHFKDGDLVEHFKKKHDAIFPSKIFNPIYYSEEKLTELLAINVYNKFQCNECSKIFETEAEVVAHIKVSHDGKNDGAWKIVGEHQNAPVYLICGYCQQTVECNGYLSHFKEHSYNFGCSKCPHQSQDLAELIFHEKYEHNIDTTAHHFTTFPEWIKNKLFNTKLVFFNGLVVKNYNVRGSKFDEYKLFSVFTEGLVDLKKERLKQLIEMKEKSERNERNERNERSEQSKSNEEKPNEQSKPNEQNKPNDHTESNADLNESRPSPQRSDSMVDPNELWLMEMLNEQRKLANNLCIIGISRNQVNKGNGREIFRKICQKLGVNVPSNAITNIEYQNRSLIVKLNQISIKHTILDRARDTDIWSNDVMRLSRGQTPWNIQIGNHLTSFYAKMWRSARKFQFKNALHSFRLASDGLLVRRTVRDAEQICLSTRQLNDYVRFN